MEEKQYFEQRLDDQIDWYSGKSQTNQQAFKRLRVVEIVAAGLIPFLVSLVGDDPMGNGFRVTVAVLGVLVAVASGVAALYRFQENWVEYRMTCEALTREKFRYLTRTEPYDVEQAFKLLVGRVESILSKENSAWGATMKNPPQETGEPS